MVTMERGLLTLTLLLLPMLSPAMDMAAMVTTARGQPMLMLRPDMAATMAATVDTAATVDMAATVTTARGLLMPSLDTAATMVATDTAATVVMVMAATTVNPPRVQRELANLLSKNK